VSATGDEGRPMQMRAPLRRMCHRIQAQAIHAVVGNQSSSSWWKNTRKWAESATALIQAWLCGNAEPEHFQQCRRAHSFWLVQAWLRS
jgi:hypothetical protein